MGENKHLMGRICHDDEIQKMIPKHLEKPVTGRSGGWQSKEGRGVLEAGWKITELNGGFLDSQV